MKVWIAANKDGSKCLHFFKPERVESLSGDWWYSGYKVESILIDENCLDDDRIPRLTWEDEPVEIDIHWINKITINK